MKFGRADLFSILKDVKRQGKRIKLKRRWLLGLPITKRERKKLKENRNRYLPELLRKDDMFYESVRTHVERAFGAHHIERVNSIPQDDKDNEKEVGDALKTLFSTGVVARSEMFITSKLWISDSAPEDVSKELTKTLEDLQLDYIDLYLIHWPFRTNSGSRGWDPEVMAPLCLSETWNAMEGLFASGQARAIGVSNFSTKKLQDLIRYAKISPAVNQVECHPVWQQPALHDFCMSTGVHLTAYSPLGSPGSRIKGEILKEPILIEIAEKLNKSPTQVALRWGLQSGHSVLPKSVNESRIKENLSLFRYSDPVGSGAIESAKRFTTSYRTKCYNNK